MKHLICALLLAFSVSASATGYTGHELLKDYQSYTRAMSQRDITTPNDFAAGMYAGFVMGIHESGAGTQTYCIPKGTLKKEALYIVGRFATLSPKDSLKEDAAVIVLAAFIQRWPCGDGT